MDWILNFILPPLACYLCCMCCNKHNEVELPVNEQLLNPTTYQYSIDNMNYNNVEVDFPEQNSDLSDDEVHFLVACDDSEGESANRLFRRVKEIK